MLGTDFTEKLSNQQML